MFKSPFNTVLLAVIVLTVPLVIFSVEFAPSAPAPNIRSFPTVIFVILFKVEPLTIKELKDEFFPLRLTVESVNAESAAETSPAIVRFVPF